MLDVTLSFFSHFAQSYADFLSGEKTLVKWTEPDKDVLVLSLNWFNSHR